MRFDVITIFPKFFERFANEALIARAQKKKLIVIKTHNLRDFASDKRGTVDDRPYGGGAGMILMAEPIAKAVQSVTLRRFAPQGNKGRKRRRPLLKVIVFSAKGKKFTQATARRWAKLDQLIMICGRYEGIDERVVRHVADEEISIGEYVLFGGEVPATVVMEAVTRLVPGAIGKQESLREESFADAGFLEYPHYTRPEKLAIQGKTTRVPQVLLSGDHRKIEAWRKKHARLSTRNH